MTAFSQNFSGGDPGVLPDPVGVLFDYMKQFIDEELVKDEEKVRIVPLWHAIKVKK